MKTTRRDALLLAGLAAARKAMAQTAGTNLSITNSAGVTIRPLGDQRTPAVSVSLPNTGTDGAVVIEMPEHAWRKKAKTDDSVWFYRMYTRDAQVKGQPVWSRDGNALTYRMTVPAGVTLNAKATLDRDGVTIEYSVVNPDDVAYAEVQAPTCIKLYRPFTDVFLERSWVHHGGGLELLASETPERLRKNAEEWLPCRYLVRCSPDAAPPPTHAERDTDGITHYYKQRRADAPFIATESNPQGWIAATHSIDAPDVWTNPARACHHADYGVALPANGNVRIVLKLYLLRGGPQEAWARVADSARGRRV